LLADAAQSFEKKTAVLLQWSIRHISPVCLSPEEAVRTALEHIQRPAKCRFKFAKIAGAKQNVHSTEPHFA